MTPWIVELSCGSCFSTLKVEVPAMVCPITPDHIHVECAGLALQWFAAHVAPDLEPLSPAPSVSSPSGVRSSHHRGTP